MAIRNNEIIKGLSDYILSNPGPQGPQGPQGEKGDIGQGITPKGTDTVENILLKVGVDGDFWIASDTGDGYVFNGTDWINTGAIRGPQGEPGADGAPGSVEDIGVGGIQAENLASDIPVSTFTNDAGYTDNTVADAATLGLVTLEASLAETNLTATEALEKSNSLLSDVVTITGSIDTIDTSIATQDATISAISETANLSLSTANTALAASENSITADEVANAINTNTTTIDGSKITTGSIGADRLEVFGLSTFTNDLGFTDDTVANSALTATAALNTTVAEVSTTATEASLTAETANAAANTAQSTANSAQSTANTAYTTSQNVQSQVNAVSSEVSIVATDTLTAQQRADAAWTKAYEAAVQAGTALTLADAAVQPSEVANAVNSNSTTINGGMITTGSLAAAKIASGTSSISGGTFSLGAGSTVAGYSGIGVFQSDTSSKFGAICANAYSHALAVGTASANAAAVIVNSTSSSYTTNKTSAEIASSDSAATFLNVNYGAGVKVGYNNYAFYSLGGISGPFTGSHDGLVKKIDAQPEVGDILVDLSLYKAKNVNDAICVNGLSSEPLQKTVIGVFSSASNETHIPASLSALETDETTGFSKSVMDASITDYEDYNGVIINSIGEGMINVCSENGDIMIGDYITTSSVPGKGMKQDDDLLHSYTVAKARESVDWTQESETIKMIACTYHCG